MEFWAAGENQGICWEKQCNSAVGAGGLHGRLFDRSPGVAVKGTEYRQTIDSGVLTDQDFGH